MTFELWILNQIQNLSTPFFDKIWVFITLLGDGGILMLLLALVLMFFKTSRKVGVMCFVAIVIGALLTNGLLKNLVQRPRPFMHKDIILLIKAPKDFSFPSGHTTASFALAFTVMKTRLKIKNILIGPIALTVASLIAFSRLYLYVHYPSDILAGIVIAFIASHLAYYLIEKKELIKLKS